MNTIQPDGEDEHDHTLQDGSWAWVKVGALTLCIADRGDYVEVGSYTTGETEPTHQVCFDKE